MSPMTCAWSSQRTLYIAGSGGCPKLHLEDQVGLDEALESLLTWNVHPVQCEFFQESVSFVILALEAVVQAGDGAGGFHSSLSRNAESPGSRVPDALPLFDFSGSASPTSSKLEKMLRRACFTRLKATHPIGVGFGPRSRHGRHRELVKVVDWCGAQG